MGAPHRRPRLSSIDQLPEVCAEDVAWVKEELRTRRLSQTDILHEFNARIIAKGQRAISKSAFARFSGKHQINAVGGENSPDRTTQAPEGAGMSGPFDTIGLKVTATGAIFVGQRTFWSEGSFLLRGQWVTLKRPRRDDDHVILIGPDGAEIRCGLLHDAGFPDPAGALEAARQCAERRASAGLSLRMATSGRARHGMRERLRRHLHISLVTVTRATAQAIDLLLLPARPGHSLLARLRRAAGHDDLRELDPLPECVPVRVKSARGEVDQRELRCPECNCVIPQRRTADSSPEDQQSLPAQECPSSDAPRRELSGQNHQTTCSPPGSDDHEGKRAAGSAESKNGGGK